MAHTVDIRRAGGEFVVKGSSLSLPVSSDPVGSVLPVDGSLRYNPVSGSVEYFKTAAWIAISNPLSNNALAGQVTALELDLDAERQARIQADNDEVLLRITGDAYLSDRIDGIVTDVTAVQQDVGTISTDITNLSSNVNAEIANRQSAFGALSSQIDITNANVDQLTLVLTDTTSSINANVAALSSTLNSQISSTNANVTSLASSLNVLDTEVEEIANNIANITALSDPTAVVNITTQIVNLTAQMATATAAIAAEQTARTSADNTFTSQIATLNTGLDVVETAIVDEQNARISADSAFAVQLTDLTTEIEETATAILAEQTARIAALAGFDTTLAQFLSSQPFSRSNFDTDAEFVAAADAAGLSYPTPYMTRYDLPPQSIDIMRVGVVPSNLLADAANNTATIQDVIDWLASKTNGGTIVGHGFQPRYENPIIALAKTSGQPYALLLKPKVSFDFGPGVRFRAAETMETMVETVVDPSVNAGVGRLQNIGIHGGFWDADRNADHCFRIREFEDIRFGGNGMILHGAVRSPLRLGDSLRSKNSYGLNANQFKVSNGTLAYGVSAVAAIESVHGFSDSHFSNLILTGYPKGIVGEIFTSRMIGLHVWSNADAHGPLQVGFDCSGGQNVFIGSQVDNPYASAYRITGGSNYRFVGCTATMDLSAVADPTKPATNTIPVVFVDPATAAGAGVDVIGCFGNDRSDATFSRLVDGSTSGVTVRDSRLRYGANVQEIDRGFARSSARITTVAGAAPTVNVSQNITGVTRNADADYTFDMDQDQPSLDYQIVVSCIPTSYPQVLIPVIRDKQVGSFRVQIVDASGNLTRPETITVSTSRM